MSKTYPSLPPVGFCTGLGVSMPLEPETTNTPARLAARRPCWTRLGSITMLAMTSAPAETASSIAAFCLAAVPPPSYTRIFQPSACAASFRPVAGDTQPLSCDEHVMAATVSCLGALTGSDGPLNRAGNGVRAAFSWVDVLPPSLVPPEPVEPPPPLSLE